MKKVRTNLFKALFVASVSMVALSSCQKEAEVLPAPTVTTATPPASRRIACLNK